MGTKFIIQQQKKTHHNPEYIPDYVWMQTSTKKNKFKK